MADNASLRPPMFVRRGRIEQASYKDPLIPMYRSNPLIEALPPILSKKDATVLLARRPEYKEEQRMYPSHLRFHLIRSALQLFVPSGIHLGLEQALSSLLRIGYVERNPSEIGFWGDINQRLQALGSSGFAYGNLGVAAASLTVLGCSGVGKSTGLQAVLHLYPQVIIHSQYQGQNFTHVQIVWLKLDCPSNGSLKSLCLSFIESVDCLIGTTYLRDYGCESRTAETLVPVMARIAAIHTLGVLVIDEIQNLNETRSGGYRRMLNFFVELINTIGLPVVLIGTPAAKTILSGELRQARRGAAPGDLIWDRMTENDTWEMFIRLLWKYQYTQKECELTPQIRKILYEESQGITDFAVKLYMLAQIRAITTGKENITSGIIQSVAKDSLRLARPALNALKSGNSQEIGKYEDLCPIDIEPYLQQAEESVDQFDFPIKTQKNLAADEAAKHKDVELQEQVCTPLSEELAICPQSTSSPITGRKRGKASKVDRKTSGANCQNAPIDTGLLLAMKHAEESDRSIYEVLQQAGAIPATTQYAVEKEGLK